MALRCFCSPQHRGGAQIYFFWLCALWVSTTCSVNSEVLTKNCIKKVIVVTDV